MRILIMLVFTVLSQSALGVPSDGVLSRTSKDGQTVSNLDSEKKPNTSGKTNPQNSTETAAIDSLAVAPIEQPNGKSKDEQLKEDSLDPLTRRYLWATIIGVVGAWIGLVVLITQTIISRTSAQRQLRAYVLPENAGLFDGTTVTPAQPANANTPGVAMTIKNFGQTPAYKVISFFQIAVITVNSENTMLVVPPIPEQFATTLGTGGTFHKTLWFDRPLAANEVADIVTGVRAVYLYGRIEYRDAFKKFRFTNFRFRYTGQYPAPPNAIFNFSERGNDAN